MPKLLVCDFSIAYLPLQPERRAAWWRAMVLIGELLRQARFESQACPQMVDPGAGTEGDLVGRAQENFQIQDSTPVVIPVIISQ